MVTDRQRRFIESAFDAVTASQYGCNEIGSIAYECPEGNLHVMDHNVYVEIEPFTEQERAAGTGHVIVTARHNKVMPFIRYDTGDIAGVERCILYVWLPWSSIRTDRCKKR